MCRGAERNPASSPTYLPNPTDGSLVFEQRPSVIQCKKSLGRQLHFPPSIVMNLSACQATGSFCYGLHLLFQMLHAHAVSPPLFCAIGQTAIGLLGSSTLCSGYARFSALSLNLQHSSPQARQTPMNKDSTIGTRPDRAHNSQSLRQSYSQRVQGGQGYPTCRCSTLFGAS